MNKKRKSFVLHKDSLDILLDLTDVEAGKLFKAIYAYQVNNDINLDQITKMVFLPFKNQFLRDDDKYTETCGRRAIAGSKGGKQKVVNASNCKQEVANVADSVSKSDSDSVSDSKSGNKRFIKPSVKEIYDYMIEKGFDSIFEAEKFNDYYSSNGWLVGKNKMKDWEAAIRNWLKGKSQTTVNNSVNKPKAFSQ